MNVRPAWIVGMTIVTAAIVAGFTPSALAQDNAPSTQPAAADGFPYVARIRGTNVNIRSGPDGNYYRVWKASGGEEVTVFGRQYDWLCIAPPKGCHSLIDREYVDRKADGIGVVNGDDVWVRAGSEIDSHRYARQVKLRKGTEVQLLGETSDGAFYKIAPPEGARVWVHGQFVTKGDGSVVSKSPASPTLPTEATPAPRPRPREGAAGSSATGRPTTQPAGPSPFGRYAAEIASIEEGIKAEQQKPFAQQNMKALAERLQPIAGQDDEVVAKMYAQRRMEQLLTKNELSGIIENLEVAKREVDKQHEIGEIARRAIKPPPERVLDGRVSATGEFRPSAVFGSQSTAFPRRYRLVDPTSEKTVAYVELPTGSTIDPDPFYGKLVTVYARERKLTSGTIQPLSVLLADEIRQEAKGFAPGLIKLPDAENASASAPPAPRADGPTTRPAPTGSAAPTTQPAAGQ